MSSREAGEQLAIELLSALEQDAEASAAFGGRILDSSAGWALPHLVVESRPDGTVQLIARVRGTSIAAADRLAKAWPVIDAREDLVVHLRDHFRDPSDRRCAYAVMVIRQRRGAIIPVRRPREAPIAA